MKFTSPVFSTLRCLMAASLLAMPLWSQDKPVPAADGKPAQEGAKPGGDPFVKKKGAPAAAAPAADAEPLNLAIVQEVVTLPLEQYHQLVETTPDSGQFYLEVEKLKTTGQAKLETLMAITTVSGQRAQVEQSDEVRYPTEWTPPNTPEAFPFPTAYEMRPTGQRFEVDPVAAADGQTTDLSMAFPITRLTAFEELRTDPAKPGCTLPKFDTREITTAATLFHNRPQLIGTLNHSITTEAGSQNMVRLFFARVTPVTLGEAKKPWPQEKAGSANLRLTTSIFSMDQATALLLLKNAGDPEAVHVALMEQVRTQKANLERVLTCATRSGQRAKTKEAEEFRFPTEFNPPQAGETVIAQTDGKATTVHSGLALPPAWTAFDTRNLGWSVEEDPELKPLTGAVDLSIELELTLFRGWLKGHEIVEKRDPPMPQFENRKITTALRVVPGRHSLLGTISPPQDTNVNGRKDDGRIWLAFVTVSLD